MGDRQLKVEESKSEEKIYVIIPPDGGWGWVIVAAAFITTFLSDGVIMTGGLFLDSFEKEFNITLAKASLVTSMSSMFYSFSGPFVSAFVNCLGFRAVAFLGGLMTAGAYAGAGLCTSIEQILGINCFFGGIGVNMLYSPANIILGFYFEKWRALATGIASTGATIGTIVLPPFINFFLNKWGWRISYYILGALMLIPAILALTYLPIKPIAITPDLLAMKSYNVLPTAKVTKKRKKWCSCCDTGDMSNRYHPTTDQVVDRNALPLAFQRNADIVGRSPKKNACKRSCKNCVRCLFCHSCRKDKYQLPLYKDDIYYNTSLARLPSYRNATSMQDITAPARKLEYSMSVTRIPSAYEKPKTGLCFPLLRAASTLLDITLLKSPSFWFFAFSGLFLVAGYMVPYVYITNRSRSYGIDENLSFLLLSTLGIGNTIGRIVGGVISSATKTDMVVLSIVLQIIGGTAAVASIFLKHVAFQFAFATLFGFCVSCVCLRPVIIVELYGLKHLTNAYGLTFFFMGFGSYYAIYLCGFLRDLTQSYDAGFYLCCGNLYVGAICYAVLPILRKWELDHNILT